LEISYELHITKRVIPGKAIQECDNRRTNRDT